LFLTAAVDVQRGSEKGDGNPARLEMEICGHGENFRTWSINYLKFEGSVSDPWDGAWAAMDKWVRSGGFNNFVRPDGKRVMVEMVFIDSGDGTLTDVVYAFCGKWTRTFPCKGTQTLKKTRESAGDAIDGMNVRRYKTSTIPGGQRLVVISTNYYKHHIYNNLNNTYRYLDEKEGRPGICYFPFDYEDSYFAMLTAEDRRTDGSFHCPSGRRNEALDLRVMNLAASSLFIDQLVDQAKLDAKVAKLPVREIEKINYRFIFGLLRKRSKPKNL
jgi:phage terminase large subunit GpA-like protein